MAAEDAMLVDFLACLDDYIPAIPDELVEYYLAAGGFLTQDSRLTRLVAVATQKFVSEVASDALQYSKMRSNKPPTANTSGKQQRLVLTSEDLTAALREFGVNVKRQEYFADNPAAGTPAAAATTSTTSGTATATHQQQPPELGQQQP